MFRKLLMLFCIISIVTLSSLSWGQDYDFRHTRWGMSQEEVLASEKIDLIEKNGNMLRYKTQLLGKNVDLLYLFVEGKLIGATYQLEENYLNSDHFMRAYTEFKEALTNKYGQPTTEITNWINDTYKKVRTKWGLGLSLGHLEYGTIWKTASENILLSLRGENYNVLCLLEYSSITYAHLSGNINEPEKLDPF